MIILGENAQEKLHIWDSSNVIDMEMIWRDMAFKFCNYVLFQMSMLWWLYSPLVMYVRVFK